MFTRLKEIIKEENMIEPFDRIIIGISGGADSVCLLHLLWRLQEEYKLDLFGVHIHHGLRKEADEDANYVREFTSSLHIPCQVYYVNILEEAQKRNLGEEETGRQIRYEIFQKECVLRNAKKIAVGHHMDDQGETFLMRLIRGSGSLGLGSMKKVEGNVIRPLLYFTRKEVEQYCHKKSLHYCQDHTNQLSIYTRNRIRLELIPYIKKYLNPNIIQTLNQTAELLQEQEEYMAVETEKIYQKCIKEEGGTFRISIELLQQQAAALQGRILYKALTEYAGQKKNVGYVHVESIFQLMKGQSGKKIHLPYQVMVYKQYDELIFTKDQMVTTGYSYPLQIPGKQYIPECNRWICTEIIQKDQSREDFCQNNYTIYLDYDRITNKLVLRTRQPGDIILLSYETQRKKIKNFFIDNKIPYEKRNQIPLLAQKDEILWIVGYRCSGNYPVTEETNTVLKITFLDHT